MKILICSLNYAPELTGIGKYSGGMAAWLAGRGHEVRVIAAPPYYPQWRLVRGYACKPYGRECIDGVEIRRCPLYVPARPSGMKRLLHLVSFAVSSTPIMLWQVFWRPDAVLIVEPPLFCAPMAWLVARLSGGKGWLHIQDFEVDAAYSLGILPFAWTHGLVAALESWLMRRFDVVSSISASMVRRLREKGVDESRTLMCPNWADLESVRYDASGALAFRQRHRIPKHAFVALYAGNMGEKQGLEVVIDAAVRMVQHKHIIFILCGDGAAKPRLQVQAASLGIGNVRFLPLQPVEVLAAMLSAADLHLVIQRAGAADLVMPSKLTNILAVGGRALITAEAGSELGRFVRAHACIGALCPPADAVSLANAIHAQAHTGSGACRSEIRSLAERMLAKDSILRGVEERLLSLVE